MMLNTDARPATTPDPPNESAPPAIVCRGLVKRFGDLVAVDGLDLDVARGECFGLLGPNGAGKTTTVEILEGLTVPDEGQLEILGMSWGAGRDQALRERLGVQLQETQLGDKLQVLEVLQLFRSFYREGRDPGDALRLVELESKAKVRVHRLSGGQRQRLALACALIGNPEILFLDEPTTGLDPAARQQLWGLVERFRADGGSILLTTHYMDEASRLCDRLAVIDHGKAIARGTPHELIQELGAQQVIEVEVEDRLDLEALRELPAVQSVAGREDRVVLDVSHIGEALPALLQEITRQGTVPRTIATHRATLDDVFLRLTGRQLRDG